MGDRGGPAFRRPRHGSRQPPRRERLPQPQQRLLDCDPDNDQTVTPEELPDRFVMLLRRAAPAGDVPSAETSIGGGPRIVRHGPMWFQRMDVNADNDLSPRSFFAARRGLRNSTKITTALSTPHEAERADANSASPR